MLLHKLSYKTSCVTRQAMLFHKLCYKTNYVAPQAVLQDKLCYKASCVTRQAMLQGKQCYSTICVTRQTVLLDKLCYKVNFVTPQAVCQHGKRKLKVCPSSDITEMLGEKQSPREGGGFRSRLFHLFLNLFLFILRAGCENRKTPTTVVSF